MINWNEIQTVFLDMDGTLLDLHFDNHFWRDYVPEQYAIRHEMTVEEARADLFPRFESAEGTMDWYCVDYWSKELKLDIAALKHNLKHLIRIRPHTIEFLDALRELGHRLVLVTNAHNKSLALKMEVTLISGHFDRLICTHDIGIPKENFDFWDQLQQVEKFDKKTTLLVDDSLSVLESAKQYGIKNLLAISHPDLKAEARTIEGFDAIQHFSELMPLIKS